MGTFRKYFFILLFVFVPVFSHAQVSNIVFTSEPQTIKPGEISSTITIQLQDSAGSSYKSTETVDIEFLSSSLSGEFLSPSSDNAVTKTISTGSANKNFRYRDSTEGTFTITVNATGRTSLQKWSANQAIIISNISPTSTTTATTTTEETPTTKTSSSPSSSNTVTISSHYTATPLTSVKSEAKFAIGAGRDRLGTVGAPIEFKVESNKEITRQTILKWNFGDGLVGYGEVVSHTYLYSGDYVAVLNASGPDGQAVSRVNVRIVPSELSISFASSERIEITNNSSSEVNLYGRALTAYSKIFVFPQDTIVKSKQKVSFGANVTGLSPISQFQVSLLIVGTEVKPQEVMAKIAEQKLEQIAYVQSQISKLQKQLVDVSSKQKIVKSKEVVTDPVIKNTSSVEAVNNEPQTASVINIVAPKSNSRVVSSWWQTLKHFFFGAQE